MMNIFKGLINARFRALYEDTIHNRYHSAYKNER